jgi:hypothetical protein
MEEKCTICREERNVISYYDREGMKYYYCLQCEQNKPGKCFECREYTTKKYYISEKRFTCEDCYYIYNGPVSPILTKRAIK